MTTPVGPQGSPSYAYRGAVIRANATGTLFTLHLAGPTPEGWDGLGNLALPDRMVDSWLDHGRLLATYAKRA